MDNNVAATIELIDEALLELGSHRLSDQGLFILDSNLSAPYYQKFNLALYNAAILALCFEVTTSGTTFHIDRCREIPEWSFQWIDANRKKFKEEITLLFSSFILVEYRGKRTILRLFDRLGTEIRRFTYTNGIGLNFLNEKTYKLYPPIVS